MFTLTVYPLPKSRDHSQILKIDKNVPVGVPPTPHRPIRKRINLPSINRTQNKLFSFIAHESNFVSFLFVTVLKRQYFHQMFDSNHQVLVSNRSVSIRYCVQFLPILAVGNVCFVNSYWAYKYVSCFTASFCLAKTSLCLRFSCTSNKNG